MLVYLLAKSGVTLCKFKEAFWELLTHYCSSKPVISLPTLHHRPNTPGSAVGITVASQQEGHGVCMFALCPCGSLLPQPKNIHLGADQLATLKLTFGVNVYSCPVNVSPAMSSRLVHPSPKCSWERLQTPPPPTPL